MIKIRIIAIGKDKDVWVTDACRHFQKLLGRDAEVEFKFLQAVKPGKLSPAEIKKREGEVIVGALGKGLTIALSDGGQSLGSVQFAEILQRWQIESRGTIQFLIGGPYGLADDILSAADHILSLSPMTFSHQIVRIVLLEQLYRAYSILRGTDYHR
ncbi:MAG: 23S rRNA (pseudouridine(1915)-N(3))-methyltransferase RlmH [bacterium]